MNGILTTGLAILSGVCLYAAMHHAWAGWRRPLLQVHVLFAWLCLLISLYVLVKLGAYRAESASALVHWRRVEVSFAMIFFAVFPWFVASYTGVRQRFVLLGFTASAAVLLTANLALPHGALYFEMPPFRLLTLPWGETVADMRVTQRGAWFLAGWSNALLNFAYAGYACAHQYRRGDRQRAAPLALALGVFLAFLLFNQAVNYGLVEFAHAAEFGFIALVLLMSRALSRELRQSADALMDSETRFRSLVEQSPFSIQVLAPDGRTRLVNRAWEAMWGIKLEALAKYNILNDRQLVDKGVMPYLRRGFAGEAVEIPPVVYNPQDTPEVASAPYRDRWVRAYVYPIQDEARRVREVILMHEDVTERRRIESSLQTSEERLRATLDNTPGVAVQWFDRAGRVLYWNTASEKLYGIPTAQAVGKTMLELLHTPEQFKEFLDFIATIERQGRAHGPAEIDIRSVNGAEVTVLYTMFAIPGAGSEPIFVCMDVDITKRKHAEAERERLLAELSTRNIEMENFVYTISHDLKAPLITVGGFASLLVKDIERNDKERGRESVEEIRKAVEGMQQLIEDLLLLSRTGQVQGEPEDVDLHALLADVQARCASHIERERTTIRVVSPLPRLYVDRQRFSQVLQNLLENGVKFHRDGVDPVLEIGAERNNGEARLYVRDNGVGIEKRYQEKIFGLFQRLDTGREGTGVGLTIARRIIEQHGGRLWVESEPGRGSTFWISLPDSVIVDGGAGESARDIRTLR